MNYTLNLTEVELNTVLGSLAKQPFELVYELIFNIKTQVERQLTVTDEKKEPADSSIE
jgi:hypothetical protein